MTSEELAELRRVVEAMTPAPWRWGRGGSADDNFFTVYGARHDSISHPRFVLKIDPSSGAGTIAADTDGIVALRNAAKDLLAAVEDAARLRAELAAWAVELEKSRDGQHIAAEVRCRFRIGGAK